MASGEDTSYMGKALTCAAVGIEGQRLMEKVSAFLKFDSSLGSNKTPHVNPCLILAQICSYPNQSGTQKH